VLIILKLVNVMPVDDTPEQALAACRMSPHIAPDPSRANPPAVPDSAARPAARASSGSAQLPNLPAVA
jgi:hypothetical protein